MKVKILIIPVVLMLLSTSSFAIFSWKWYSEDIFVRGKGFHKTQVNVDNIGVCDAKRYVQKGYDYPVGTDAPGICSVCSGRGSIGEGFIENVSAGQDPFSDCGPVGCSSYYTVQGVQGSLTTEYCYSVEDEPAATVYCDGAGECFDAADVCPDNPAETSQLHYECGICKYIGGSSCTGQNLGSCTNYPPGADCGFAKVCDGTGNCVCVSGYTDCNGYCVNLQTDDANCGSCNVACNQNSDCNQGNCECDSGYYDCNGPGDGSDSDGCESSSPCFLDCAGQDKCVFVSSQKYTGNLGGVTGAHQKCQNLAQTAGYSGTYKAWICGDDTSRDPEAEFTHYSGQYELVNGVVVADSWADLTDGNLDAQIAIDETGAQVNQELVFTNVRIDGRCDGHACNCEYPCNSGSGWNYAGANGCGGGGCGSDAGAEMGNTYYLDSAWTEYSESYSGACYGDYRIYCFEQ